MTETPPNSLLSCHFSKYVLDASYWSWRGKDNTTPSLKSMQPGWGEGLRMERGRPTGNGPLLGSQGHRATSRRGVGRGNPEGE